MAFFVDRKKTFPVEITDPETGEKASVELRKLDAGDYADRSEKMMRVDVDKDPRTGKPKENISLGTGAAKLFTIHRSIVRWDLHVPVSFGAIRSLDDSVQEELYGHIKELNPRLSRSDMDLMEAIGGDEGDDGSDESFANSTDEEYGDTNHVEEDPT